MALWSDLPRRLVTICIGIPTLWIIWSNTVTRQLFFPAVHLLVGYEWVQLIGVLPAMHFAFPLSSLALSFVANDQLFTMALVVWVSVGTLLIGSLSQGVSADSKKSDNATPATATSDSAGIVGLLVGAILITIPFRSWNFVARDFKHLVGLLLTVWNGDTGALLAGRLSKSLRPADNPPVPPLWLRRISPNKSLVGLFGGIICATFTFVGLHRFWNWMEAWKLVPDDALHPAVVPFVERCAVGLVLGCLAILGDLFESYWKRYFGVKDTSKLLPGHGGILDRFDSSLLAVLFYKFYMENYLVGKDNDNV